VGLSYSGLEALGVPEQSLATFPSEFRQGMAARADYIGDVGENAPEHWEAALGSKDVHLVAAALARDTSLMETLVMLAQDAIRDLPGVAPIWALDVHMPPDGREQFGFKDSISEPAVEGTNILGSNRHEAPLKAGEFVLGYEDENGDHLRQPVARHHRHALTVLIGGLDGPPISDGVDQPTSRSFPYLVPATPTRRTG
jgi:deferrochelatase/peroxidase EfeB